MDKTLLFHYGCDGGGASVYQLPNGKVIEIGASGGLFDEEDDPYKQWENTYDSWPAWWSHYVDTHKDFWICFHPSSVHASVKTFIKAAVDNYAFTGSDNDYHKTCWYESLEETNTYNNDRK